MSAEKATVAHQPNDYVRVNWSNGAGYTIYQIVEQQQGPSQFIPIKDYEWVEVGHAQLTKTYRRGKE